jgi:hypothetical protein
MKLHWLSVLGVALLFSSVVFAQGTGSISGVVQDESGAVVPGATVTVTNVDTGIASTYTTDATGGYHVPSLNPGNYEVRAQSSGFETAIRRGLQLTVGSSLDITMPLKVGQVAQQTVVTAEAPIVNTLNSSVGALVDAVTIKDLPLNGRSFDQLISLESSAPTFRSRGRAASYGQGDLYTVNGANTAANLYMIDGTEMAGAGLGFQLPGGVLGKNLGVDAIQEFVVLSSNYSAGYGKKGGGIINIATRSGTNQIHGSAYEYLRNSALDARNYFDGKTLPLFQRNEFGGSLGGPVKKDNSFLFGNYEGLRENLGVSKVSVVPNALAHQGFLPDPARPGQLLNIGVATAIRPYLDTLFPLPNGQDFGDGSAALSTNPNQVNRLDFFLVRFDQKLSDKDFLFARYNFDQASQSSPDLTSASPLFFSTARNRDQIATLEVKRLFSPTTINLARAGFSRAYVQSTSLSAPLPSSLNFTPGADTVGIIMFSASGNNVAQQGLTKSGTGNNYDVTYASNQYEVADQVFHYMGKHSLQLGIQFQRTQNNDAPGGPPRGQYVFLGGLTSFLQAKPSQFSGVPSIPGTFDKHKSYRRTYFSTFVQDDYKVLRNLTLNLGFRYELLTVPTEASGNRISNYGYTFVNGARILNATPNLGSPMFTGNHLNLAPRFGFAWDPRGDGKMSVRGGFGVFYDQDIQANHFYLANNAPYATTYTVTNPVFLNPFGGGATNPPLPSPDTLDPAAWKTPTRLQYSFGIQRQITSSTVLNIGYVGANAYHMGRLSNGNTVVPTLQGGQIFYPLGQPRLQPLLSSNSRFVTTDANTSYNSLQTEFTQRLSHGLRYKVSYTYSKSLSGSSGNIASYANGELGVTQNPYNARAEWGPSPFNLKHNFVTNFTYDIPWGGTSGLSGKLLGGWQVGGIVTAHPGTPFTVSDGFNRSRNGDNNAPDRPNLAPGANGVTILGGPDRYFDSSVFVLPPVGTYGNVGRNTLTGPGFASVDFNVAKTTSVNERLRIEFRAEFFNILNHANFDLPSAKIFDSTGQYLGSAGHVSATVTTSRQIQGGLKFIF